MEVDLDVVFEERIDGGDGFGIRIGGAWFEKESEDDVSGSSVVEAAGNGSRGGGAAEARRLMGGLRYGSFKEARIDDGAGGREASVAAGTLSLLGSAAAAGRHLRVIFLNQIRRVWITRSANLQNIGACSKDRRT